MCALTASSSSGCEEEDKDRIGVMFACRWIARLVGGDSSSNAWLLILLSRSLATS